MIIIDSNEKRSKVPQLLSRIDSNFRFENLSLGDYIVGGFVVERKTVSNFIGDLFSGHLDEQVERMAASFEKSAVAVIGDIQLECLYRKNVDASKVSKKLASIVAKRAGRGKKANVSGYFFQTPTEFCYFLKGLDEKSGDILHPPLKVKSSISNPALAILTCIPGVGEAKGEKLLEKFGSLREIFTAEKKELSQVKGIGDTIADSIKEVYS